MRYTFLFCLSLFSATITQAMENIPNEIIVYTIGFHLNRLTRNNLRSTNKKLAQLILPQSILNEHYAQACQKKDTLTMLDWRNKGALHRHEEVYNLFITQQLGLAQRIRRKDTVFFNDESAFTHGITLHNQKFIAWLLSEIKPLSNSTILANAINLASALNYTDIVKDIVNYIQRKTTSEDKYAYAFYTNADYSNRGWGWGGGPPPY